MNDDRSNGIAVMASYVSNAFQARRMGNMTAYRQLIQQLRTEGDPVVLTRLLTALTQCISSISSHAHELVDAVLSLPWLKYSNDDALVTAYLDFYESLLSAHASFAVPCIRTAAMQLTFAPGSPVRDALGDDATDAAIAAAFAHVHDFMATVLRVVPTSFHALLPNLTEAFPHKRLDTPSHVWYLRNLLLVLGYAPALLADIIGLIVDRMIQIDVEIQVDLEDIAALQSGEFDDAAAFEGDGLDDDDEEDGDYGMAMSPRAAQAQLRRLIDKLDSMMLIMFEFLQQRCLENPNVNAEHVLKAILQTFERTVMQTSRSRHIQFLYFYFVCAATPSLDEKFLGFLMQILLNSDKSVIVRQSAAAYIASFVARARVVTASTARSCLELLVKWLHSFLDYFESSGRDDDHEPQRHALFYYVCQAVFYIVCFRHAQLFARTAEVDGAAAMHRLGLDRIVNSRLNPLRVCLPTVVNEFARVMHAHQVVYCYAALQRNNGSGNGGGGSGSGNVTPAALSPDAAVQFESFFAFEPFNLRKSARFVEPLYQRWEDREGADEWEGGIGGVAAASAVVASGSGTLTAAAAFAASATSVGSMMMMMGGGADGYVASPAVQIAGSARRRTAPEDDDDEDELADLVLSPESVEMDFMFQMRSPSANAGAALMAQHARRRSGRR